MQGGGENQEIIAIGEIQSRLNKLKTLQSVKIRRKLTLGSGYDAQGIITVDNAWNDLAPATSQIHGLTIKDVSIIPLLNEVNAGETAQVGNNPDLLRFMIDTDYSAVNNFTVSGYLPQSVFDQKALYFWQRSGGESVERRGLAEPFAYVTRSTVDEDVEFYGLVPRKGTKLHVGFDFDNSSVGLDIIIEFTLNRVLLTSDESLQYNLGETINNG